ncbi:maker680 [Drosophila busckii]|uniref:Maker680 n=1 Tax=Drosophila busckii TaxID=30019 RepID=A0A0M4ENU8_DROBS|nr:uncharacterized protein LOC108599204 [Drosophila busckii]ALC43692.1 maker680 [Drosophila busckii]
MLHQWKRAEVELMLKLYIKYKSGNHSGRTRVWENVVKEMQSRGVYHCNMQPDRKFHCLMSTYYKTKKRLQGQSPVARKSKWYYFNIMKSIAEAADEPAYDDDDKDAVICLDDIETDDDDDIDIEQLMLAIDQPTASEVDSAYSNLNEALKFSGVKQLVAIREDLEQTNALQEESNELLKQNNELMEKFLARRTK